MNSSDNKLKEVVKLGQEVRRSRQELFLSGYESIASKLREVYRLLTNGGDAALELVDSLDPFSEGVQFTVRPPKKTWK